MTKCPAPRRASLNTCDVNHVTEETVRDRIDELIEDALKDTAGVEGSRSDAQDAFFADPYRARYR